MKAYHIALFLLAFNIVIAFLGTLGTFNGTVQPAEGTDSGGVNLTQAAGGGWSTLRDMILTIGTFTGASMIIGGAATAITKNMYPFLFAVFGGVFWGLYANTVGVFVQFVPLSIIALFTPLFVIVFIASLIQLGSGGWKTYE
ncbi:MAG: hypothetical protein GWP10_17775 [Nitrospiraceae bacterium]|nr:hypothetical protein [Nitrospiraceae bacterium]